MRQITLILLFISFILVRLDAQEKFDCDGSAYISVVDENEVTTFFELSVGDQSIVQSPISAGFANNINAIGFNRKDSLIYGIDPEVHQLFRVGADGAVEVLKFLPLIGNYYAGDISPEGDNLVLFNNDSIAIVNLSDAEIPVSYQKVTTTTDSLGVFVTDIAFHPVTHILYGYDAVQGKLITINESTGVVDNTTFPRINYNSGLPAMFFDARAELYGIGTNSAVQESILFHFDIVSGLASRSGFEGNFGDRDGCSCPFTLKLFQKQNNAFLFPCSSLELVLTVANLTGEALNGYHLEQSLPEGYIIESIPYNPFAATIDSGEGTNRISLVDMQIPNGVDSIVLIVTVPEQAGGENHSIQATLEGPNSTTLNTNIIVSDDLGTGEKNDSTPIVIQELEIVFDALITDWVELCEGDTFALQLPSLPEIEYIWSDSVDMASRVFSESGEFKLDILSTCSNTSYNLSIQETAFSVDLGADLVAEFGDIITLESNGNSLSPITSYIWKTDDGDIPCSNCPTIQVKPLEDSKYVLVAKNETGCSTTDEINIRVDRGVYCPNIFSPDGNGINDFYYLLSGNPVVAISELNIYNRWGVQVFRAENIFTNDELSGWNGQFRGSAAQEGAYVWTAVLKFNDGRDTPIQGQFILSR